MRNVFFMFVSLVFVFGVLSVSYANDIPKKAEAIFSAIDRDGDGRISRDEWEAVDKNKNNKITKKEWERFHFKSNGKVDGWNVIGWYDFNNNGFMDKEEFMRNFRNR